jgi:hypothetical protein
MTHEEVFVQFEMIFVDTSKLFIEGIKRPVKSVVDRPRIESVIVSIPRRDQAPAKG